MKLIPMSPRPRRCPRSLLLLLTLAIPALGSCGRTPAGDVGAPALTGPQGHELSAVDAAVSPPDAMGLDPAAAGRGGFYPLEQGNRWSYERRVTFQVLPDVGPPPPAEELTASIESKIIGTEELFGRAYTVLHERWDESGDLTDQWIRYRQDQGGLYEADVSQTEPPDGAPPADSDLAAVTLPGVGAQLQRAAAVPATAALAQAQARMAARALDRGWLRALDVVARRSALLWDAGRAAGRAAGHAAGRDGGRLAPTPRDGGPQEGELLRLRYPLRPAAQWDVRDDEVGTFTSTVEASERLALPAGGFSAWRLRMESSLFGPQDDVHFWYGRCGQLQLVAHLEGEATDMAGNRIGTLVWDERTELVDLTLARRGCR